MYTTPLHSCVLTKKFQRKNEENDSFCDCNKKSKIPRNKLNKDCEEPIHWKLQDNVKGNGKRYKEIER